MDGFNCVISLAEALVEIGFEEAKTVLAANGGGEIPGNGAAAE